MAKVTKNQNGVIPGGGTMTGPDDFSDGESTPLTQDYGGRYNNFITVIFLRDPKIRSANYI